MLARWLKRVRSNATRTHAGHAQGEKWTSFAKRFTLLIRALEGIFNSQQPRLAFCCLERTNVIKVSMNELVDGTSLHFGTRGV